MQEPAKFAAKKLYEVTTGAQYESESIQSMWAYSVKYINKVTTGRFRMTMQKVSAAEMIEALGGSIDQQQVDTVAYSISAYLEKWCPGKGWIHVIDWMGNPNSSFSEIESNLYDMYKAFVTGTEANIVNEDFFPSFDPDPFPPSTKPEAKKIIIPKPDVPPRSPSDSDFDWI